MKKTLLFVGMMLAMNACSTLKNGNYRIDIVSTNDVHGTWFDSSYTDGKTKNSLMAVNHYVDSLRKLNPNLVLVDAGDCLQGDNAPYYYNYVDTLSPHLFPRLVSYMNYDAITVGNHDIETGHKVYDRVTKELDSYGIPFLGGNAINTSNGKPYFPAYKIVKKNGIKIAILGFTNPNMRAWLPEKLWSGIDFQSLIPLVQQDLDAVRAKEKPDLVIVSVHSGVGKGDGSIYESQGLDLFKSLKGADFLLCSHDHSAKIINSNNLCLINSGSHSRNIGHGIAELEVKNGKIVSKKLDSELIKVDADKADAKMREYFKKDFEKVKQFTLTEIGELQNDILTRDSYKGQSDYMNLIHLTSLLSTKAEISFAAPLTYNSRIDKGKLIYNDLFTIYPYENQLFVLELSGKEIKDYLEYSYNGWINTVSDKNPVLKIEEKENKRYATVGWSFANRPYNFDSAAGLVYTVDITKPYGNRIEIKSMANGSSFDLNKKYTVAMTSYRASGGGEIITKGAGIKAEELEGRIVNRFPEIRNLLYDYIRQEGSINSESIRNNKTVLGEWHFIPEELAKEKIGEDMQRLFGK